MTKTRPPRILCRKPVDGGKCWRTQDHNGRCVDQRYKVPPGRPLAVVSDGGVLVASFQGFQISTAQTYVRHSGGYVVDTKTGDVL